MIILTINTATIDDIIFRHCSLMYGIKTEDVYEDSSTSKEMIHFGNYSTKSKYYDNLNNLVIGIMKDETEGIAINEYVRWKPKIY